jgi:hypothetical protein
MTVARLVCVVALCLASSLAHAGPDLDRARLALERLDYPTAKRALEQALESGENGPEELREVCRLLGVVDAAFGDNAGAFEAFRRWLVLEPTATLDEGMAPKVRAPLARARSWVDSQGWLALRLGDPTGDPRNIVVAIESDPLGMVAGARAEYRRRDGMVRSVSVKGNASLVLLLPGDARGRIRVSPIDRRGNRLADLWLDAPDGGGSRPPYLRWPLWGGTAVAFAAVGAYFGARTAAARDELDAIIADSSNHTFEEARRLERRGNRYALYANLSYGAAAASAVAAAALPFFGDDRRTSAGTPQLSGRLLRGGGLVSATWRF